MVAILSKNVGTCFGCNKIFNYKEINKHLNGCVKTTKFNLKTANSIEIFRIKVFAGNIFWLYIEMSAIAPLQVLDQFLRIIWVECCEHLSQFATNGVACNMDDPINKLFKKGSEFSYEYDFGSTTYLKGKIIDQYQGTLKKDIRLLARNNMPKLKCRICSMKPTAICSVCYELYCKKCVKRHNCDEELISSVVNSPRMGVCGYDGMEDKDDLKQFLP